MDFGKLDNSVGDQLGVPPRQAGPDRRVQQLGWTAG